MSARLSNPGHRDTGLSGRRGDDHPGADVPLREQTGYPSQVSTHQAQKSRTFARRAAVALSVAIVGLVFLPGAALADTPATAPDAPDVSGLQWLVVLFLIPAGLALVISLLTALPSMISDKGYEPGQTWRSEPEWFGGPRKGVEAAEDVSAAQIESAESGRGGTSGTW